MRFTISGAGQTSPEPSWSGLVQRIRSGDPSAMEELYGVFSKGIRILLCRQLGPQDLDNKLHDVFLIITLAIRRGDLREPERLVGYVRTVVRRQVAEHIDSAVEARRNWTSVDSDASLRDESRDPERAAIAGQNERLALRILGSIPRRDREILIRFYLKEQSAEQICREMELHLSSLRRSRGIAAPSLRGDDAVIRQLGA
jgi:RNA polymerase sigma-70 factor, ECF subfamily